MIIKGGCGKEGILLIYSADRDNGVNVVLIPISLPENEFL
ncbi:MAG: hypothetical protein ACJAZP_002684 [Psychromonas sp.]